MKQILCFGDSNTYGYRPTDRGRFPYEIRWTGKLDRRISGDGYRVIEEGLCGRTTIFEDQLRDGRRAVDMLPTILETHSPLDTVVLMLGTNDCKKCFNASPELIGKGIERLIGQIRKFDSDIKILLVSPIELGEEVWKKEYDPEFSKDSVEVSKKLKSVYQKLADKYKCDFIAASDYAKPSVEDQEHLNEQGHEKLYEAVYSRLSA